MPTVKRRAQKVEPIHAQFYDPERDGVTASLLTTFKECREKTRIGLQGWTKDDTTLALVFGTIVHGTLESIYNDVQIGRLTSVTRNDVVEHLASVQRQWQRDNPRASDKTLELMEFTLALSEATLPAYFQYWKKDLTDLKWHALEHEFRVPMTVSCPDGIERSTFLRGKMDGVFHAAHSHKRPWLFETKTKSRIEEGVLADVMPYELQVNIYLYALRHLHRLTPAGVLYNIIRRPSLRQKNGESAKTFADRCITDVLSRLDWYFLRMEMTVDEADIDRFEGELYDLVGDFLTWWAGHAGHYRNSNACENKYGTCPMINICAHHDYNGFFKRSTAFRELEDV